RLAGAQLVVRRAAAGGARGKPEVDIAPGEFGGQGVGGHGPTGIEEPRQDSSVAEGSQLHYPAPPGEPVPRAGDLRHGGRAGGSGSKSRSRLLAISATRASWSVGE